MKRFVAATLILFLVAIGYAVFLPSLDAQPHDVYGSALNPVQQENSLPGTTSWQVTKASQHGEIQAYVGLDSVSKGQNEPLFVSTKVAHDGYTYDLYRLGYYGGKGGRLISEIQYPSAGLSQGYYDASVDPGNPIGCPTCITSMKDSKGQETYLVDANWQRTNLIPTSSLVSGLYLVKLTETNGGYQWEVPFVVRDDSRSANLVYEVPFNTDEAYNSWGGVSLYRNYHLYPPTGIGSTAPFWAFYVSFNRPYTQDYGTGNALVYSYRFIRFMEQLGYDVTYTTNNAIDLGYTNLLNYKGFVTAGHDEYWSHAERQKLETAIADKVNVAFFGANDMYWQIRNITDTHGNPNGIIVEYKDYSDPHPYDPYDVAGGSSQYLTTTLWRASPLNDPEDKILKAMYGNGADYAGQDFRAANTSSWVYHGVSVANSASIKGILGPEVDTFYNDGSTTSNDHLTIIGDSPFAGRYGQTTQYSVLDQLTAGNIIFNGGTNGWPFGLTGDGTAIPESAVLRAMTNNILSVMTTGQPATSTPPTDGGASTAPPPDPGDGDGGGPGVPAAPPAPKPAPSASPGSPAPASQKSNGQGLPAATSQTLGATTELKPPEIMHLVAAYVLARLVSPWAAAVAVLLVGGSGAVYLVMKRRAGRRLYPEIAQLPAESAYWGKVVTSDDIEQQKTKSRER